MVIIDRLLLRAVCARVVFYFSRSFVLRASQVFFASPRSMSVLCLKKTGLSTPA